MRKALVIVDMQNEFINQHTKDLVPKILEYVKANNFDTIIGTAYVNHENTACFRFEGWNKCWIGTDEAKIVDEINKIVDITFYKDRYSCWNKEFKDYIEINEIDELYFVGVNTGCCVLHSVYDAYNDLYECRVVSDLCGSTSGLESHECAIRILKECITKERVITSKQEVNK